ncbi:MAG: hypothetical protein KC620_01500 [Myxococcales bacterium]|nr:hypothetical protein [Myxococcales bacterium]
MRIARALGLLLWALLAVACDDSAGGHGGQPTLRDGRPSADALADMAPPVDMAPAEDAAPDGRLDEMDAAPPELAVDAAIADAAPMPDAAPPIDAQTDQAPPPDQAPPAPVCGDGMREGDEACDDGDTLEDDYCAGDCSAVTGRCGDGIVQRNERCDDGQAADGCDLRHDGGNGACVALGTCSDGFVIDGEDCVPAQRDDVIDIFVDNFCNMRVDPSEVHVPGGQSVELTFRNRSRDYPVDVWLSYGGGFLDLEIGREWHDPIAHCTGPRRPRQEYADISTACSAWRLIIYCD